jgi:hypothetical protein
MKLKTKLNTKFKEKQNSNEIIENKIHQSKLETKFIK